MVSIKSQSVTEFMLFHQMDICCVVYQSMSALAKKYLEIHIIKILKNIQVFFNIALKFVY